MLDFVLMRSALCRGVDLARAKSEALYNIYSLLKQKHNRVMLSGEGDENGDKTTIGLFSKKVTLHVQHTFSYSSLPLFCTTTT